MKKSIDLRHGRACVFAMHVHLVFVTNLETKGYPSIQQALWGKSLWSPSYFASSCGGAPISIIRKYIENQQSLN